MSQVVEIREGLERRDLIAGSSSAARVLTDRSVGYCAGWSGSAAMPGRRSTSFELGGSLVQERPHRRAVIARGGQPPLRTGLQPQHLVEVPGRRRPQEAAHLRVGAGRSRAFAEPGRLSVIVATPCDVAYSTGWVVVSDSMVMTNLRESAAVVARPSRSWGAAAGRSRSSRPVPART